MNKKMKKHEDFVEKWLNYSLHRNIIDYIEKASGELPPDALCQPQSSISKLYYFNNIIFLVAVKSFVVSL